LKFGYVAESEKAIINNNSYLFVSWCSVLKNAFGFEVIRIQGRRLYDLPSLFDAIQDGLKRLAFINGHIVNLHDRGRFF
jgi:hypothetical protein